MLSAIDYAPGASIRDRIKHVADQAFPDPATGVSYRFTWRTISTWLYRYKLHGVTSIENQTRADKNHYRKVALNELAEAINDILPTLKPNKGGLIPKSVIYRQLMAKDYFQRPQLSATQFYRMVREHQLLDVNSTDKLRQSFAMRHANELWQADTMYGPSIKQADGSWRKSFLIAFIDDAGRLITHAQFFYRDNTEHMIDAFRVALYIYIIIDEAHLLDITVLRKLRLLFDRFPKRHNLVLLGQPVLLHNLSLNVNQDIKSRITYSATLYPLNDEALTQYIHDQLIGVNLGLNVFDEATVDLIVRSANGNLRLCRNLCHGSLLQAGKNARKTVGTPDVNNVLVQPHWRSHDELITGQARA